MCLEGVRNGEGEEKEAEFTVAGRTGEESEGVEDGEEGGDERVEGLGEVPRGVSGHCCRGVRR